MELLIGVVLAVLGIIGAVISRQLADEFKAWTPWLIGRLVKRAVRKLPEGQRDRFEEEWLSYLDETPGEVGKIAAALGFLLAARRMSSPISIPKRVFDIIFALFALACVAPLFLSIAIAIKMEDGGPIFVMRAVMGPNGRRAALVKFRTVPLNATSKCTRVGRVLRSVPLDQLPILINVLRGDATLPQYRDFFRRPPDRDMYWWSIYVIYSLLIACFGLLFFLACPS
jgi:hypothetical protein